MLSEETRKIDIFDILQKHLDCEIYKIKIYDCIRQCLSWVYYFRINKEYRIQINKAEFFCLRKLGIREVII